MEELSNQPPEWQTWEDQLPFAARQQLTLAVAALPFRPPGLLDNEVEELILREPFIKNIWEFPFYKPTVSKDFCDLVLPKTEDCLDAPPAPEWRSLPTDFFPPEVEDMTEFMQDEIEQPSLENIPFKFHRLKMEGKIFQRVEREIPIHRRPKPAPETDLNDEPGEGKKARPKRKMQERQYDERDELDLFDMVFPALSPSLGANFNNPLSLPHSVFPFQVEGIKFLVPSQHALLGDEMGLGKSIQTIVSIKVLFRQGKILSTLILCPKAVVGDWEQKFWDWAPELKVVRCEGSPSERRLMWNGKSHIYIATYETIRNDFKFTLGIRSLQVTPQGHYMKCPNQICRGHVEVPWEFHNRFDAEYQCPTCKVKFPYPLGGDLARTRFDLLVFDEIQKLKNTNAHITRASRIIFAKYRWALSGTPLENKVGDLISVLTTINKEIFNEVKMHSVEEIKRAYKPIFKRRRKEDVLKDLPPKVTKHVWLDLTTAQRKAYDLAEKEGVVALENKGETVTLQHVLALITRLKQICNFDPETGESVKLDYLKNDLEELTAQGDKALVFSQYVEALKKIRPSVNEHEPLLYEGSLSTHQRRDFEKRFQEGDENKVMLISLKSGNAGITLTRANYVYHFDLWWNPAVSAQAVDRAHRIGQTKTVFERMLLTDNTIERRIFDILAEKRSLFNRIVDDLSDTENLGSMMSPDELFGLFGLARAKRPTPVNAAPVEEELSQPAFEEQVVTTFERLGYTIFFNQKHKDDSLDVHARQPESEGGEAVVIRCIFFNGPRKSLNFDKIGALLKLMEKDLSLHKGYLVTNGNFHQTLEGYAQERGVELISFVKLSDWGGKVFTETGNE